MRFLIFLLLTFPAYATEEPRDEPTSQIQTQDMEQHQNQSMDQTQNQDNRQEITQNLTGGDNSATGGDATGGSASAMGDITTTITNKRPYRNTPNVYAPPVRPTVSCFKGASASIGAFGGALALGAGKIDEGCVRRELIRLAPETHKLHLFCSEPSVTEAFESFDKCMKHNVDETTDLTPTSPPQPTVYDDLPLSTAVESVESRVSELEAKYNQSEVRAQQRAKRLENVAAPPDPHAAYFARIEDLRDECADQACSTGLVE